MIGWDLLTGLYSLWPFRALDVIFAMEAAGSSLDGIFAMEAAGDLLGVP